MFEFLRVAFAPDGFRIKYFLSVNSKQLSMTRLLRSPITDYRSLEVGFPIRKSADQSLFAAPHGLSQRTTSFIASQRQGIHQIPLRHLIALIINAPPGRRRTDYRGQI